MPWCERGNSSADGSGDFMLALATIAALLHDVLEKERPNLLGIDEVQSAQLQLLRRRAAGPGSAAEKEWRGSADEPTEQGDYVLALLLRTLHLNLRLAAGADRALCKEDAAAIPGLSAQLTRLVGAASSASKTEEPDDEQEQSVQTGRGSVR